MTQIGQLGEAPAQDWMLTLGVARVPGGANVRLYREHPEHAADRSLLSYLDHIAVVDARIVNPRLGPYETLETLPEWEVAR